MSIDVNYYSFSPERADNEWANFIKDFIVLRQKHSGFSQRQKDSENLRQKTEEIELSFEKRLDDTRRQIFGFFEKEGFFIPDTEWDDDKGDPNMRLLAEDKMSYLKNHGCVYPKKNTDPENKLPYLTLPLDAPELLKKYEMIETERDKAIAELRQSMPLADYEKEEVILNLRQETLDNETGLNYLKYENYHDETELMNDLKELDIYYGSVKNEYFESPKVEFIFLEEIVDTFKLKNEEGIPTKTEWIRMFQNIDAKLFREAAASLMSSFHWDKEEAEWGLEDYLKSIRPVIKDLKETPDAIFLRIYEGYGEAEPKSAEKILLERAKIHAEKFKGLLKPVL